VLRNKTSGNGYVRPANATSNFGIGLLAGGNNLIEENIVTGNVTGIRINAAASANIFRGNVIAGNPPIVVANTVPEITASGFDIMNLSAAGTNTFENNTCVTSMNAPCGSLKSEMDMLPLASGLAFDLSRVRRGGSVTCTFSGNNLSGTTYFDVRFRAPGAGGDDVALNWQQGMSAPHAVPQTSALGDWTITGIRAHADANDHTGPFVSVQATISVFVSPF
jgi:parallel beta-helix repeat protein